MTIAAGCEMGFINCNSYWQEAGQPTDPVTIGVKTVKRR